MLFSSNLNPDALEDLYRSCKNALAAYDALETIGADEQLPGYSDCLGRLKSAIEKAEYADSELNLLEQAELLMTSQIISGELTSGDFGCIDSETFNKFREYLIANMVIKN